MTGVPLRLDALGRALEGRDGDAFDGSAAGEARLREALAAALAEIDPLSDLHASAEYRRRAATSLVLRAVRDAYRAAKGRPGRAH